MSEENIKILRAFYEAGNRRGFDDALQYMDRAVEIGLGIRAPDRGSKLHGHDGWREFIRVDIGTWEAVTVEALERIDTEDGRILSVDLWRFRGRDGIEIERELPTLYTFRDGLIVRIDGFAEKAEALKAAGLSE
jgi:ketosteroid isomerase-like protein